MYAPTERELQVLRAVIDYGSCRAAADALGIHEQTVKNNLYRFRANAKAENNEQLVYEYRDDLRSLGKRRHWT